MKKIYIGLIAIFILGLLFVADGNIFASTDYRLVKTIDDHKVFLVINNRRVHIPNEEIFEAGGYKWTDIEDISNDEMNTIKNTALIKSPIDAKVYFINDGKKEWIPGEDTFLDAGFEWNDIVLISQPQVDYYTETEYKQADAKAFVKSIEEQQSTTVKNIPSTTQVDNRYTRPSQIRVQEIGKYTDVLPDFSNKSIGSTELFENGEVFVSKFEAVSDEKMESRNYIWSDGVMRAYTEADHLYDQNEQGQKIVAIYPSNNPYFLDNGTKTRIPTLGGFSVGFSDMNDTGVAVGDSDVSGGGMDGGLSHACMWENGRLTDLGTLGGRSSSAVAVNNNEQVVGYSSDGNNESYAFLWENGQMNKIFADGQYLKSIYDVNDNEVILGGTAFHKVYIQDGVLHYFDRDAKFTAVNNHNEMVGVLMDGYFLDDNILLDYPRERYREILDHVQTTSQEEGYPLIHINGETMKLDDLVGDDNIVFTGVQDINDRGEMLVSGFNKQEESTYEYLVSLPNNIPPTFTFTVDGDNKVFAENYTDEEALEYMRETNPKKYTITWIDTDPDSDAKISLYYIYQCELCSRAVLDGDGTLFAEKISEDVMKDSYIWDMSDMSLGTYYLYAIIDDGNTSRRVESDRLTLMKKNYKESLLSEGNDIQAVDAL